MPCCCALSRTVIRCGWSPLLSDVLHDAFTVRRPSIDAEGKVSSQRAHLRPPLLHLLRTSRNSLGPLRSRRLRRCRSSSVADGSLRRSSSRPAIARAFAALSVGTPARWALGPCSVAMIDLHSLQTMVSGIVVVLIVRLPHVEYHRLRLIAGGAPNSGKLR